MHPHMKVAPCWNRTTDLPLIVYCKTFIVPEHTTLLGNNGKQTTLFPTKRVLYH